MHMMLDMHASYAGHACFLCQSCIHMVLDLHASDARGLVTVLLFLKSYRHSNLEFELHVAGEIKLEWKEFN